MSTYYIKLNNDYGSVILEVNASSEEAARNMVILAEDCPPSAIESCVLCN